MLLSRALDTIIAYQFIRLLTTPWEETDAFKAGLIDKVGKIIRTPKTQDEKSILTPFHKLIFNLKRILLKVPFMSARLSSYVTALYLIKEHLVKQGRDGNIVEDAFKEYLLKNSVSLTEETQTPDTTIKAGTYTVTSDMLANCAPGDTIILNTDITAFDSILGIPLFKTMNQGSEIVFTKNDIK